MESTADSYRQFDVAGNGEKASVLRLSLTNALSLSKD